VLFSHQKAGLSGDIAAAAVDPDADNETDAVDDTLRLMPVISVVWIFIYAYLP